MRCDGGGDDDDDTDVFWSPDARQRSVMDLLDELDLRSSMRPSGALMREMPEIR